MLNLCCTINCPQGDDLKNRDYYLKTAYLFTCGIAK